MNTIKSVYYGWGILIVAGGGAYAFAKRSIDADRAARADADRRKKAMQRDLEASYSTQSFRQGAPASSSGEGTSNPSAEASADPAPTRHAPETRNQEVVEKSKYEASEPWRSRKGDRFS